MKRRDRIIMATFAAKLKEARQRAGYEHASDFAADLGVEVHCYRHWERGSAQPRIPYLVRISRLLKTPLAELLPQSYQADNDKAA